MLNAVNNYNTLGRLGPHYERPEYSPPSPDREPSRPESWGDRRTLTSVKKEETKNQPAPVSVPTGRLNLASARNLVEDLAGQINDLPPLSTDREPHTWLRSYLMTPVYV